MKTVYIDELSRLHIAGWATDDQTPQGPVSLDLLVDDLTMQVQATEPLDGGRLGFSHVFSPALIVSQSHEIAFRDPITMCRIAGSDRTIQALDPRSRTMPPASFQAAFVTALGRSGSSLMMRYLATHPQIAVARQGLHEMKMASYYADALRVMLLPGDHDKSTIHNGHFRDPFYVGLNPYYLPIYCHGADARDELFQITIKDILTKAFRGVLDRFYEHVRTENRKPTALMFAEKLAPEPLPRAMVRTLYPNAKEILLVRDPRDTLCSARAYFPHGASITIDTISRRANNVLHATEDIGDHGLVVRYEDLVTRTTEAVSRVFEFLGLQVDVQIDSQDALFAQHGRSESPVKSIGKWRAILDADEQAECGAQFKTYLQRFGYDV
jgi:hypothetical protein